MIDFDRKPTRKSAEEAEFDALNETYAAQFGTPYVFDFAAESMTWAEVLADMRQCIATNKPQPAPEYKNGVDY